MIPLLSLMEWLLSSWWVTKLDFRMFYLKSWKCFLYLLWNDDLSGRHTSCDSPGKLDYIHRSFRIVVGVLSYMV